MAHARRNRRGASRMAQRNRYGFRSVGTRATLPIMTLVFDDARTAPAYFEFLKPQVRQHVVLRIVTAPTGGASPRKVVERASHLQRELRRDQAANERNRDSTWALFDMEHTPHQRDQANEAIKLAEKKSISVAISDPCFEVWTLLHLDDTGRGFDNCDQVRARIAKLWSNEFGQPFDSKANADYSLILPRRNDAARRARRHWERQDPSRTEVFRIIEEVERHVGVGGASNDVTSTRSGGKPAGSKKTNN